MVSRSGPIVIAGGGIAGLTAALAFAARSFDVEIIERSDTFGAVGAGVQLSPNATRILGRLGVLGLLEGAAVQPLAIYLRDARTMRPIAHVPLGGEAERRWGAPYLVAHRADLQAALLDRVARVASIRLATGSAVKGFTALADGVDVAIEATGGSRRIRGALLIGADGVWSNLRQRIDAAAHSVFTHQVAWRRTIPADPAMAQELMPDNTVDAFLGSGFHLVAYPLRGGDEINLVAFTPGADSDETWSRTGDAALLARAFRAAGGLLERLATEAGAWKSYPIHVAPPTQRWVFPRCVLIGDAAHAMTPYAAQGAAMAIEDAETLAATVAEVRADGGLQPALQAWESSRRPRVDRVRRRGAFNRFAWHAAGPVAIARDFILARRSPSSLAADLDWLYGYDPDPRGADQL